MIHSSPTSPPDPTHTPSAAHLLSFEIRQEQYGGHGQVSSVNSTNKGVVVVLDKVLAGTVVAVAVHQGAAEGKGGEVVAHLYLEGHRTTTSMVLRARSVKKEAMMHFSVGTGLIKAFSLKQL
jgi:ribosomal protein L24